MKPTNMNTTIQMSVPQRQAVIVAAEEMLLSMSARVKSTLWAHAKQDPLIQACLELVDAGLTEDDFDIGLLTESHITVNMPRRLNGAYAIAARLKSTTKSSLMRDVLDKANREILWTEVTKVLGDDLGEQVRSALEKAGVEGFEVEKVEEKSDE